MIIKIVNIVASKIYEFQIKNKMGISTKGKLVIKGKPLIEIRYNANICLGNNVTLNSKNQGYHVNMHSPVKLFADKKDAKIKIGDNTRIHGTCIHAYEYIEIGSNCLVAANCQIFDGSGHDLSFDNPSNRINTNGNSKPVYISDNVWIGAGSIILPGVKIGQGAVVAAGSIVTKNVEDMTVVGGNPAKVINMKGWLDV